MADKHNLMRGRESWIFLELCLYLLAHFQGGGCKSVPSWCHHASMNGHRQPGQRNDHRVCSNIFSARREVAEGAEWKRRTSVWWIPGCTEVDGTFATELSETGISPCLFGNVCFGNVFLFVLEMRILKATSEGRSPLPCREMLSKAWTLATSSCFGPNSRKHLTHT